MGRNCKISVSYFEIQYIIHVHLGIQSDRQMQGIAIIPI